MIEALRDLLWNKGAFLGFMVGAIPAALLALKDPPESFNDYLVLVLVILNGGLSGDRLLKKVQEYRNETGKAVPGDQDRG